MAIELVEKYLPFVDEQFTEESKKQYLTNNDFNFAGAKSVKIYKVSTGTMQDYGRINGGQYTQLASRYGTIEDLNATTQTMMLSKDRLPKNFGFMVAHPCATVAPTKLESYKTHQDPPGISGNLVEGRIVYDAFVLDNKKKAIYYQEITSTE